MATIIDIIKKLYLNEYKDGLITFYQPADKVVIKDWLVPNVEQPTQAYLDSLMPQYQHEFDCDEFENSVYWIIKKLINDTAMQKSYDSTISCASYATSTNPQWKAEAETFIAWRDTVLAFCYSKLEAIRNQQIPIPTIPELLASLPEIVWP